MISAIVALAVVILVIGIFADNVPIAIGSVVAMLAAILRAITEASNGHMEAMVEVVKRMKK